MTEPLNTNTNTNTKRCVFITGCSTGIGYQIATELYQHGFQVLASCRKAQDVERLRALGIDCIQLDLNNSHSIQAAIEQIHQLSRGKLYALINNGAYGQPGALEDLPTDALRAQFETNFFGWHQLTTGLLPLLLDQPQARIIQVSSVLGFAAMKYRGAYNASKFALEGWSDTLRLELMNTGVAVSIIEPGPIETRFRVNGLIAFKKWINPQISRHQSAYQLQLQRLAKERSNNRFVLPASACLPAVLHALQAHRPKIRYRITTPTKLFAWLKRLLPSRILDKILSKAA